MVVGGIKIGMKAQEVEAVIRGADAKASITKQGMGTAVKSLYAQTAFGGNRETITVVFGPGTGSATLITRQVESGQAGISVGDLRSALEEKYGAGIPAGKAPLSPRGGCMREARTLTQTRAHDA